MYVQNDVNYRVTAPLLKIKSVVILHIRFEEAYLFSRVLFNTLGRHVRVFNFKSFDLNIS